MVSISCVEEVTVYLEKLNEASSVINELEIQIEKSRQHYKNILLEAKDSLAAINLKKKSYIERARSYFDAVSQRENLMGAISRNSQLYCDAKARHEEAKKALLSFDGNSKFKESDQSQLEGINLAINNVNSCKDLEQALLNEHERLLEQCRTYDDLRRQLESRFSTSIKKARPYFEVQASMKHEMQEVKERIESLSELLNEKKRLYAQSMKHLEDISNRIHMARISNTVNPVLSSVPCINPFRSFGVGAESTSSNSSGAFSSHNLGSNIDKSFRSRSFRVVSNRSSDLSEPCSTRPTPPGQLDTESEGECADRNIFDICGDDGGRISSRESSIGVMTVASKISKLRETNIDCFEKLKFFDDFTLTASLSTSTGANPVDFQSRPSDTTLCGPAGQFQAPLPGPPFSSHQRRFSI